MSGGYSFNRVSGSAFPGLGAMTWSADHLTLRIRVTLTPGQQYRMQITGAGFQSADGVPVVERRWGFRTEP